MKTNPKIISSVIILIALVLFTAFSIFEKENPPVKIELLKTRVVYFGVENPVLISVPGYEKKDIFVAAEGCKVWTIPTLDKYIIEPSGHKMVRINVKVKSGDELKTIATDSFRVKDIQDPVLYFGNHSEDCTMRLDEIRKEAGLFSRMVNCDFDGTFKITSFSMSIYSNGAWKESTNEGPAFTDAQKADLAALQAGDRIIFHHVNVKGFGEITRTIPGMFVTVQ
jgi:hypothetical protein